MGNLAPVLETERLLMRGWRESDLDVVAAWSADPVVSRFVGGVMDREQAWRSIAAYIGHWHLRGYGLWAVERKHDGALIGRIGLWNPEGWPGLEVGWLLVRDAWGQGYAHEGGAAAMAWAWLNLDTPGLISVIDPANAASISVAQRLGMTFRHEHLLRGTTPTVIYGIQRP